MANLGTSQLSIEKYLTGYADTQLLHISILNVPLCAHRRRLKSQVTLAQLLLRPCLDTKAPPSVAVLLPQCRLVQTFCTAAPTTIQWELAGFLQQHVTTSGPTATHRDDSSPKTSSRNSTLCHTRLSCHWISKTLKCQERARRTGDSFSVLSLGSGHFIPLAGRAIRGSEVKGLTHQ